MKNAIFRISLLLLMAMAASVADVRYDAFPQNLQLYPRDVETGKAKLQIKGVFIGETVPQVEVLVYRNGVLSDSILNQTTPGGSGDFFNVEVEIPAELAMYRIQFSSVDQGGVAHYLRGADSLVAGDVYIVEGQSNAESEQKGGSKNSGKENNSPYVRVLGWGKEDSVTLDTNWYIGQGDGERNTKGNTGQWPLRVAKKIIDNHGIPVAIFNGAHGGRYLEFFHRNDNNPTAMNTNYGRLLSRVNHTGYNNNIRAIFWYQGESSAYGEHRRTTKEYYDGFMKLHSTWKEDYKGFKKAYLMQVRNGCGGRTITGITEIQEAHRQIARDLNNGEIMSTSALEHHTDNCHYIYQTGYKHLGDWVYDLVDRDLYGAKNKLNIEPPNIQFVEKSAENKVDLVLKNVLDSVKWYSGSSSYFKVEGGNQKVTYGVVKGNRVTLTLSGKADDVTSISYMGRKTLAPEPLVTNLNGIGAVHFHKLPITDAAYRDSASVAMILKRNNLSVGVDAVAAKNAEGRVTGLKLPGLGISTLPLEIAHLDSLSSIDLDNNFLCHVHEGLVSWINEKTGNTGWMNGQKAGPNTNCDGTTSIGLFEISKKTSIPQIQAINGVISIKPGCDCDVRSLTIFNLKGQEVFSQNSKLAGPLILEGYKRGLYLLRLETGLGVESAKFLLE